MAFPATFLDIQEDVALKAHMQLADSKQTISDWINASYAEVASTTRCFVTTGNSIMTSGVSSYIIDSSILHIELLTSSGWPWPLEECELFQIRNLQANKAVGPSRKYCLVGMDQLEVWPTPTAADTLTFDYTFLPTPLVTDGEVPLLPEPHASNLLGYGALVQAAEAKRDVMMLGDFQSQYAASMQDFQKYMNRKPGAYPMRFPVFGTTLGIPHDPSTDIPYYVTN